MPRGIPKSKVAPPPNAGTETQTPNVTGEVKRRGGRPRGSKNKQRHTWATAAVQSLSTPISRVSFAQTAGQLGQQYFEQIARAGHDSEKIQKLIDSMAVERENVLNVYEMYNTLVTMCQRFISGPRTPILAEERTMTAGGR